MNYQAALKDFKKVQNDLTGLKFSEEITYDDNIIQLEIRTISMLIVRHYSGDIKGQGEIWGNHLIRIPKTTINNHLRLKSITALVDKIVEDIESRIGAIGEPQKLKEEESNNPLSALQRQINKVQTELDNADNKKTKLQREIKDLESQLKEERSQLGMYSESVARIERERKEEINHKIKHRKDDLLLLQSEINSLKSDKARFEDQLKAEQNKKGDDVVHSDIHGKYTLPELIRVYDSLVRTNISQGSTLSETSNLLENEKRKNQDLQRQIDSNQTNNQRQSMHERDFYKPFLTAIYVLISYIWLSSSTKILGFVVKDNFKYGVAVAILILYGVLFFSTRDKIKDNIVQFIIGIGAVVLGAFFFYR